MIRSNALETLFKVGHGLQERGKDSFIVEIDGIVHPHPQNLLYEVYVLSCIIGIARIKARRRCLAAYEKAQGTASVPVLVSLEV